MLQTIRGFLISCLVVFMGMGLAFAQGAPTSLPSALKNLVTKPDLSNKLVDFNWDANPSEENVLGYKFYIGFKQGEWVNPSGQDIGLTTSLVNRDLDPVKEYFYGFVAYNSLGNGPLTEVKVSLTGERKFVTPTPDGGTFVEPILVSFDMPESYLVTYTLDGSDPSNADNYLNSHIYTTPFTINKTATLRYFVTDRESDYMQDVRDVKYVIDISPLDIPPVEKTFEGAQPGAAVVKSGLDGEEVKGETNALVATMTIKTDRLIAKRSNTITASLLDAAGKMVADNLAVTLNLLKEGARTTTTFGAASKNGLATFIIPGDQIEEGNYELWTFSNNIESSRVLLKASLMDNLEETGTGMEWLLLLTFVTGIGIIKALQKRSAL